jgi:hypothetical protein
MLGYGVFVTTSSFALKSGFIRDKRINMTRTVILHYHLFKNAGSSLDAAFKVNFDVNKGEWVTAEFPSSPELNREQVKQWIIDNPKAKCFSSHTASLPPPQIEGVKVIPVIFMRHPIDRIASAYVFESKQGSDNYGAVLARNTGFSGYVETRLSTPNDHQCRNFHAHRLARMYDNEIGDEQMRAIKALENLPFVGVVETFSASLEKLEKLLIAEGFENLVLKPLERNVSRGVKKSLDEKLVEIKEQLGDESFDKLIAANKADLSIWNNL